MWVKALHIIAVVCWFAALFYLPRLYVYHAMSDDAVSHQRFEVMERKLYRGIMWPSMIATLITAHFLVEWGDATRHYHEALWFYLKVGLVGLLVGLGADHMIEQVHSVVGQCVGVEPLDERDGALLKCPHVDATVGPVCKHQVQGATRRLEVVARPHL